HAFEARLRGAVVGVRLAGDVGIDRGDVDDPAPAAPDHAHGGALRQAKAGVEVDLDDLVPLGVGRLARRPGVAVAGVVHEDIEVAELGLDAVHARIGRGDVG